MHRPPASAMEVSRSLPVLAGMALLWFSGLPLMGLACSAQTSLPLILLALASWLGAGSYAAWQWLCQATGRLRWDGERWYWSGLGDEALSSVLLAADFQKLMLVRICGAGGTCDWLCLVQGAGTGDWHGMRCALVHAQKHAIAPGC